MTTLKPSYGAAVSLACTTTALASDSNLLAGRQSNVANNSTDLGDDILLTGTIATSGTITINTVIEIWVFSSVDNTNFTGGAANTGDADLTEASLGMKRTMALGAVIDQTDTTARTYPIPTISLAELFGTVPEYWGVFIVQNTGATLGATALKYLPVQYTNA